MELAPYQTHPKSIIKSFDKHFFMDKIQGFILLQKQKLLKKL